METGLRFAGNGIKIIHRTGAEDRFILNLLHSVATQQLYDIFAC